MTFDIYLSEPQKGVPRSRQKTTALKVIVSHHNIKYKKNIGITLYPYQFVHGHATDPKVDARIRAVKSYLNETLDEYATPSEIQERLNDTRRIVKENLDAESLKNAKELDRIKEATKSSGTPSFSEYLDYWWPLGGSSSRQRKLFRDNIAKFFGTELGWDDIDETFRFRLEQKMNEEEFAINYKWKMVSQLKTVMEEGRKLKYHTNLAYKDWHVKREAVDAVYLTMDEVDRIWNLELTSVQEMKARDLFIVGVYTVSRFSDYSRISEQSIDSEGYIRIVHKKTGAVVHIPVSSRVRAVLDRNGGSVPSMCSQNFNDAIKRVCRKAGINEVIETRHSRGKGYVTEKKEKWELVSSHTARRTGATLMRLGGTSMRGIMLVGGWAEESTLEKYIRMGSKENAVAMKDNPFFK